MKEGNTALQKAQSLGGKKKINSFVRIHSTIIQPTDTHRYTPVDKLREKKKKTNPLIVLL